MAVETTRMRGADAGFLYLETPAMHMHTLKMAILDASPELNYDNLVKAMLFRLRRLPPLRRRVVPVPGALNHPVLVTERRLDPDQHFFRHDLGGSGTMRDFERVVGEVAGRQLDRSVPLWELHVVEGMAGGRVGIIGKIHHALADGIAANALLANVMDVSSADLRPDVIVDPAGGSVEPSRVRLTLEALRDAALQVFILPALIVRTVKALAGMLRYRRDEAEGVPLPIKDAPRTSFNGPLTPARSFATVTLPIADMKSVRKKYAGVSGLDALTLNDVVLGVTSGALRRWLAEHGEHPSASLTAGVPVGMDARDGGPRLSGNNVSNMFTTLGTDIDDPTERLRVVSTSARHAKVMNQALGSSISDWSQFTPPAPVSAAVRAYSRHRGARLHPAPFSAIVSNVPGPRERVKIGGAHLAEVFSVGPLIEGIGLNVTVWSYVDRMNFSLLACPDLLPDVERLASYFPAALAELLGQDGEPSAIDQPDEPNRHDSGRQESA